MDFTASSLISINHKELKKLSFLMAVPPEAKAMYDNDNSIETVQGRAREDLVLGLHHFESTKMKAGETGNIS